MTEWDEILTFLGLAGLALQGSDERSLDSDGWSGDSGGWLIMIFLSLCFFLSLGSNKSNDNPTHSEHLTL